MEQTIQQLANDIAILKWLIGIVAIFLFIVTSMLLFAFKMLWRAVKNTDIRAEANLFQDQANTLLEEGKDKDLKVLAGDRLESYPADAWAHYFFALASYRLRDFVQAKQHFTKSGELNPQFKSLADESLKEIDTILSNQKPRIV